MTAPVFSTLSLAVTAASSVLLGAIVLLRNPHGRTHRAFAVLALDLMLWTLGILIIVNSRTESSAAFWVRATFCAAVFLPATFFHFILLFPGQRIEGPRWLLWTFYVSAVGLSVGAWTPWYISRIAVIPGMPPEVEYGAVFYGFAACIFTGMAFAYPNLYRKWRKAEGIQRRQIEHVLLGIVVSTFLASATNVMAPLFDIRSMQIYGPIFFVLMVAIFCYSMIRYHLLDMWLIVSRTTVYAVGTGFVILTFFGSVSLVHWVFRAGDLLATFLAALVIALVLQPLKERVQLILNRTILKRRYDLHQLLARVSKNAARIVRLDELLSTVCDDVRNTVGVRLIRVLLLDEKAPNALLTEYSSLPVERGRTASQQAELIDYVRANPDPLVLEQLLHTQPIKEHTKIAKHLAELDAFLCVPLQTTSGLLGVLTLGQKTSRDIYTKDDIVVFGALAGPLATAIQNARLYHKLEEVSLYRERILSNMRGGVIAVDVHGTITTVNQFATDLLGPIDTGQDSSVLPHLVGEVLMRTLRGNRALTDFETVITLPDREPIPVVMSTSCLSSSDNGPTGAMVMIFDMSEVRRLQRHVQGAQRLSSIGTLAAGMAHEIKNPLVSIKTFTQLLPSRYDDPDFRATVTEILPHEVERIDSIVTRLLDFARPKPVDFAPQNLRVIIEEVLALVISQTRSSNIQVETEYPDEVVEIYGDEQQLHQVFLNLVLNSIEALRQSPATRLSVRVNYGSMRVRRNGHVTPEEVDCVRIAVVDSGCGISAENLERVFTPFFTTKDEGTGLGLSVVHGIVTEHGGQIDITSGVGEGTTVVVTLPLANKMAAAPGNGP